MRYNKVLPVLVACIYVVIGLTGAARANDSANSSSDANEVQPALSDRFRTCVRYCQFVAVGEVVSDPIVSQEGKPSLVSSQFDFKLTEILKGPTNVSTTINVLIYRAKNQEPLQARQKLVLFLNPWNGSKWSRQNPPPNWVGASALEDAVLANTAVIQTVSQLIATMPAPVAGAIQLEQLTRKYLPGFIRRGTATDTDAPRSADILVAPSGQEFNLGSARNEWRGMTFWLPPLDSPFNNAGFETTHWRNETLTSLLSSFGLKVQNTSDAEDIGRMVLGLFAGPGVLDTWAVKASQWEHGWVVTPNYIGPTAQVFAQGPIELILEDGVVRDARRREAMFFKENVATVASSSSEPGWGEAVQGLSVRLQSDNSVWYLSQPLALRLSIRNLGKTTFMVPESQEEGELLVDDAWYLLRQPETFAVIHKALAPGRQYENIAVQPTAEWRAGEKRIEPLASKHTLRFAVRAQPEAKENSTAIRVVSNPLEVEFRFGVPPRAPVSAK